MTALCKFQVVPEQLLVVGVYTLLNDVLCALLWALSTQVGDTLFGDDDVDVVLGVVLMAHERHDGTDEAALGCGWAGENAQIGVALEVAGTADTIHHLHAADVCGVDVAIDVALDGGVDGNHTETADDSRVVGDLTLAQCQVVFEVVHVVVYLHEAFVAHGERAGRGVLHTAGEHHVDDRILNHLSIDVEVGHMLVGTQCAEDGIGGAAHATLQG